MLFAHEDVAREACQFIATVLCVLIDMLSSVIHKTKRSAMQLLSYWELRRVTGSSYLCACCSWMRKQAGGNGLAWTMIHCMLIELY